MFIEIEVKQVSTLHGYDTNNNEIVVLSNETVFVTKIIAMQRIQSISEQYLLVSGSHNRVHY